MITFITMKHLLTKVVILRYQIRETSLPLLLGLLKLNLAIDPLRLPFIRFLSHIAFLDPSNLLAIDDYNHTLSLFSLWFLPISSFHLCCPPHDKSFNLRLLCCRLTTLCSSIGSLPVNILLRLPWLGVIEKPSTFSTA